MIAENYSFSEKARAKQSQRGFVPRKISLNLAGKAMGLPAMNQFRPRTDLPTHQISNQPEPLGEIALFADPALRGAVESAYARLRRLYAPTQAAQLHEQIAHMEAFGKTIGRQDVRDLGRQADENPPKLHTFNGQGQRIDEVEFHPAYHQLMKLGLENGVSSRAWTHQSGGHIAHGTLLGMMSWADGGVCCPMSMTYAVTAVLKNEPWADKQWTPLVTSADYDERVLPTTQKTTATMGMAMTEKQGGSDLRTNTTIADAIDDDTVQLRGHKWFCSAPMCDAFLTLAQEETGASGETGLSCFLVPRWRPDGTRNAMEIQRLKDKIGDRSNASSEIEYRGAWARRIGAPGRGIATIITMAHHTRYDCISGSAAAMRKAVIMAVNHVRQRKAFQKKLIDQPLMRGVLADLIVESEAALALAMRVGASFDAAPLDAHEAALSRVLTPIAKYWVCKRQTSVITEALECFGGIGFVEETGMGRLYRSAPLNGIWEGSGNIMALDIERAMGNDAANAAFTTEITRIGDEIPVLEGLVDWLKQAAGENQRLFAERAALVFCADALPAGPVRDAFITLRLMAPSHLWGANADKVDCDTLIARAVDWL